MPKKKVEKDNSKGMKMIMNLLKGT